MVVCGPGAVQRPVGVLLLHSQAEKVGFQRDEVEVLVKNRGYQF